MTYCWQGWLVAREGKVASLSLQCPRVTILTSSHHPCRIFTETCTAVAWSQLPRAIISSTVRIVSFLLLIIHSIPSQPWRNSMPHLAPGARCRSVTFPCQKSVPCHTYVSHVAISAVRPGTRIHIHQTPLSRPVALLVSSIDSKLPTRSAPFSP